MATKHNGNEYFWNLPVSVVAVGATLVMALFAAIVLSLLPDYSANFFSLPDLSAVSDGGGGGGETSSPVAVSGEEKTETTVNNIPASSLPVFRFAMLYWKSRPTHIYYYCKDMTAIDSRDQAVLSHASLIDETEPTASIDIEAFDDPSTVELPEMVQEVIDAHNVNERPIFVVTTAWNRPIFTGELNEELIDAMFDSPLRTKTAELLADGAGCVFVVVTGSNEAANMKAIENVEAAAEALRSGEMKIPDQGNVPMRCEVMTVDRTDQAERWFVASLLAIEEKLADESMAAIPIAFPIYGRMQSLPPLVGPDISATSLRLAIQLLGQKCCWTKEMPMCGCDIPIRWDWEQTAKKLNSTSDDTISNPNK